MLQKVWEQRLSGSVINKCVNKGGVNKVILSHSLKYHHYNR